MTFTNPILPGFYPDPSITKKGDDYYLVTSSFEFFPGVPIFHSKDLVNWKQIGHCLTRKSQLDLEGIRYSRGIYAPTIRYNPQDDLFYMTTTNVSKIGNFYVTATDPAGEWSDPIAVELGGIDPSFYFEDDGTAHYMSNDRDRDVHRAGFLMAPIDLKTGKFLEEPKPVWGGTGGNAPEAPHIYKTRGYYYQVIAEGGTELGHMVTVARSKNLYGPYESCPYNPILTHRDQKGKLIQATGHADFIEDENGDWWAFFLGYRQTHQYFHHLGRETFLAPIQWKDDWPIINGGKPITTIMETEQGTAVQKREKTYQTNFRDGISYEWVYLRNPMEECYQTGKSGLALTGNQHTLSHVANPAFLGFRQQDLTAHFEADLTFSPSRDHEEAGLSVFYKYDAHLDVYLTKEGFNNYLCFRKVVGDIIHEETKLPILEESITIIVEADPLEYHFYAKVGDAKLYLGKGLSRYVSTEAHELGFTGTFIALYATGNGSKADSTAYFTEFRYQGKD